MNSIFLLFFIPFLSNYSEVIYLNYSLPEHIFNEIPILEPQKYLISEYFPLNIVEAGEFVKGQNNASTIDNVFLFLYRIQYEFYYYPRGDVITFKELKGDCTDISSLGVELLRLNNIKAKQVHGWAKAYTESVNYNKHDWIEIYNESNQTYYSRDDYFRPKELIKVGDGSW